MPGLEGHQSCHGGPRPLGLFRHGMVLPVALPTRSHCTKPRILSKEETILKSQEGKEYLVFKSMFDVLPVY